jgi:hypothetical protein
MTAFTESTVESAALAWLEPSAAESGTGPQSPVAVRRVSIQPTANLAISRHAT